MNKFSHRGPAVSGTVISGYAVLLANRDDACSSPVVVRWLFAIGQLFDTCDQQWAFTSPSIRTVDVTRICVLFSIRCFSTLWSRAFPLN